MLKSLTPILDKHLAIRISSSDILLNSYHSTYELGQKSMGD